eukprot:scaffold52249_cov36-Phaeocystis_antarctica.AAC.2
MPAVVQGAGSVAGAPTQRPHRSSCSCAEGTAWRQWPDTATLSSRAQMNLGEQVAHGGQRRPRLLGVQQHRVARYPPPLDPEQVQGVGGAAARRLLGG